MNEELLRFCLEKGILLDREMSEILAKLEPAEANTLIQRISQQFNEKIITKSFFSKNAEKIGEKIIEKLGISLVRLEVTREIEKKEEKPEKIRNIKIITCYKDFSKKIEVMDFVRHFRNRFSVLRSILQSRIELDNLVSINKIFGRQNVSIIGMVCGKRVTKNKNIILELEDLTGKISVLANMNKEVYETAKNVLLDDVIAVKGTGDREIIFVNNIFYPDAKINEKIKLDREEYAAFSSDFHVGSKMFLEENLLRFIDWLNGDSGDERQRQEALKVKYLFLCGDNIDGVGVYPGQEALLNIKDIKQQYKKLAEILNKIRKDVTIVMCPGQHDGVRIAEPQPVLSKEYAAPLFELENLILVSNPALVEVANDFGRGIRVLMYHGASFHFLISEIESLRIARAHDNPAKVVKEVLKRRHLASFHSSVSYNPNGVEDQLVIKEIPDIIATGDLHRPEIDVYNNILIIASSCWQSITPFEEKVGNHPDPCKVPLINLKTRQIKILDFSDEKSKEEGR